jgi:ferredoxin-type protein NapF
MVDASRRGFLRGRPRPKAQIRPPWALPETDFVDQCTRCGDCLSACPQKILVTGDGGFPTVDFSQRECTFCGNCATACQPLALVRVEGLPAWPYKAVVGDACLPKRGVECRVCGDFCDARAIRFAPRLGNCPLPAIDNTLCTGCGACVCPCPTAALRILG